MPTLHPDGWHLHFPDGQSAGPFPTIEDARAFLDYLDNLQGRLSDERNKTV